MIQHVGDFPGATSVYDLSSIELTKMIKEMNDGRSILGKSIGPATRFSVGGAFNPNVRHLKAAVKRMERKIAAGAEYFLTQPIYDAALIEEVYEATKHLEQPIFIGIMPLVSKRNADFYILKFPESRSQKKSEREWMVMKHRRQQLKKESVFHKS